MAREAAPESPEGLDGASPRRRKRSGDLRTALALGAALTRSRLRALSGLAPPLPGPRRSVGESGRCATACQERDERDDQEHDEDDLGDPRCARGDSGESEERCDERNDEENDRVVQHGWVLPSTLKGSRLHATSTHASTGVLCPRGKRGSFVTGILFICGLDAGLQ